MSSLQDLCEEIRAHPECCALIVWNTADCVAANVDPRDVWWDLVETRSIEVGWNIIDSCKDGEYM